MKAEELQEPAVAGAEKAVPRLRLRSLKVHAFRDVRPGTELQFGDGFHLILGKNATGKSTLLSLIAAVCALDFWGPFFAETPFHLEASLTIGEVTLHAEVKREVRPFFDLRRVKGLGAEQFFDRPPRDEFDIIVRLEPPSPALVRWVRIRPREGLQVFPADPREHEGLEVMSEAGLNPPWAPLVHVLIVGFHKEHPMPTSVELALSLVYPSNAFFDESLGFLRAMMEHDLFTDKEGMGGPQSLLPLPLHFCAGGEPVTLDLAKVPVLAAVIERLGFDEAKVYFGPAAAGAKGWTYSSPSFQFFRGGKAVRRHDQLSFGQRRLFSFAWYLACNPDLAVADELVNGLHSEWIDWCVEAMSDRQCFLTSQNPLLVDAVPFATTEDLRRGIILCSAAPDGHDLSWRQLDEQEVDILSRALQESRLDLLSDLLHALDLW